jgi:hypothetical protein
MKKYLAWIAVFLLCPVLSAQEPSYDVIYAVNFFDGISYNSAIVPYSAPEIYIQADAMNAFVVRETLLYYWSLTSEFKADWASRNVPLEGVLCIQDRHGNIQRLAARPYIIQYDIKDIPGTIGIYWGNDAVRKYEDFARAQRIYSEAVYQYNSAIRRYEEEINAYLQNPPEDPESFPALPLPPADFSLMSTDVNTGFPVQLPRGQYTIYFEDPQGTMVDKTKKRLTVFTPREAAGGFKVFEEGRWTVPADFPDSHRTLFTVPGAAVYLRPYHFLHYPGSAYNLMLNPQNRFNRSDFSIWVPVSPDTERSSISAGTETLSLSGYKVTQLAGSKLGYVIHPLPLDDPESEFAAFNVEVPQNSAGKTYPLGKTSALSVLRIFSGIEIVFVFISLIPLIFFALIPLVHKEK